MDRDVIESKVESLRFCLNRVREKCPPTAGELAQDVDAQDIVALNLTRAVQVCVDIATHLISANDSPPPDTMGNAFDVLAKIGIIDKELAARLKKAVGFRNIVIHNYTAVDWHIVFEITQRHLDDFSEYARTVIEKAPS